MSVTCAARNFPRCGHSGELWGQSAVRARLDFCPLLPQKLNSFDQFVGLYPLGWTGKMVNVFLKNNVDDELNAECDEV